MKVLTTPVIVGIQTVLYKKTFSSSEKSSLGLICIGGSSKWRLHIGDWILNECARCVRAWCPCNSCNRNRDGL